MAFEIKTLRQIIERVEGNIVSEFSVESPVLRNSVVKILARVIGGGVWLLQGFLDWAWKQPFAQYADIENLEDIGFSIGVDRKPATFAKGTVKFTGINGSTIAQGTQVARATDGYTYQTEDEDTIVDGFADIVVSAVFLEDALGTIIQDVGSIGNAPTGTGLETVDSITGVDTLCTAVTDIDGGVDEESEEDYRERVLFARRNPPQGGSTSDYMQWATSIAGVTDAFVTSNYPNVSDVSVTIGDYTDIDNPEVSQDIIDEVDLYINDRSRIPVTAKAYINSVIKSEIDVSAKIDPFTDEYVQQINTTLKNLFREQGTPSNDLRNPSEISKNKIQSEIAALPGLIDVEVTSVSQDFVEVEKIQLDYKQTAVLRAVNIEGI